MTNVKDACIKLGLDKETLFLLRDKNLDKGKDWKGLDHAPWFFPEGMGKLETLLRANEKEVAEEMQKATEAPVVELRVIEGALNKRFVWAEDMERHRRVACLIPNRFVGKLKGKYIQAERIESESGTSYRHVWFKEHDIK